MAGSHLPVNWTVLLATCSSTVVAVGLVLPFLRKRVVDIPNQRSSHSSPTPRGGGLGLFIGTLVGALAAWQQNQPVPAVALVVPCGLALLGFADDLISLQTRTRLVAQLSLALAVPVATIRPDSATECALVVVATVFIAGYTNAFNFMDGVNGISALVGSVTGAWFVWLGRDLGSVETAVLGAILLGASLGFVPWNALGKAKVFLGDVGSYLLGGMSAILGLLAWNDGASWQAAGAPLVLYVTDTVWAVLQRMRTRQPIGEAHRDHVYQRLARLLHSHGAVAVVVAGCVSMTCLATLLPAWYTAGCWLVILGLYVASPNLLGAIARSPGTASRPSPNRASEV
jgi:UDP-N-acetylmuramyl pentapeptide phosphotransferase/UDP-N-acetylglucosamine-1-phosphate transferase